MRAREFQTLKPGMPMMWRIFDLYTRKGHDPQEVIHAINRKFGHDLSLQDLQDYYVRSIQNENFADKKVKGRSRPGRVRRAGASCKGSVTDLRARARKYGGERGKMYHWCANMKSGRQRADESVFHTRHIGPVTVEIDDHAVDRMIDRGAEPTDVDTVLDHLRQLAPRLTDIELGQRIWVWDPDISLALGLKRIGSRDLKFSLKTVWTAGRPSDYNVAEIFRV